MAFSGNPGFGLYVHWPFCLAKCPYCDFNSHVGGTVDSDEWLRAFLSELDYFAGRVDSPVLSSIFFGGGTPSLMDPTVVEGVITAATSRFRTVNDLEVTLEANPTSVEAGRFRAFRAAGVNRVSIGVQALNDADLAALGRRHSVAEAISAIGLSREIFERSSFDLIYARQNQSLTQWESELSRALGLAGDHLSLYQLSIEEGTAFFDRRARGGLRGLPDEDLQADLFEMTQVMTEAAGLPAYEISNHARPGSESRHNFIYWRGGQWLGIGPGAHGRLGVGSARVATATLPGPQAWLAQVRDRGHGLVSDESLSGQDVDIEYLMMGLRLAEGVDLDQLGVVRLGSEVDDLVSSGHLRRTGSRLSVTAFGRPVLNAILGELLARV